MSAARKIEQRLHALSEITEVMNALKNLALAQVARVRRLASAQQRVMDTVEAATADFLRHYPRPLAPPPGTPSVILLFGSERGFCGGYNDAIAAAAATLAPDDALPVVVGRKLAARLGGRSRPAVVVEGPGSSEEVGSAITRVVAALERLPLASGMLLPSLTVVWHAPGGIPGEVRTRRAFAPPADSHASFPSPPRLYLDPDAFFRELADHYLFAFLNCVFNEALLAENEQRLQHLDAALRRIERTCAELGARRNALRQEEMTEEIEVILLSAAAASPNRRAGMKPALGGRSP